MAKSKEIEKLLEKGQTQIRERDFHKALKTATKLVNFEVPFGFVLQAQAYAGKNQIDPALKALDQLVKLEPDALYAWRIKAEFERDCSRFEESLESYRQALTCEKAPEDRILLAMASVQIMNSDYKGAIETIEKLEGLKQLTPDLTLPAKSLKLTANIGLENYEPVQNQGLEILKEAEEKLKEHFFSEYRVLYFNTNFDLARSAHFHEKEDTKALGYLMDSLKYSNGAPPAVLGMIREINNLTSDSETQLFRVHLRGKLEEPVMAHGMPHHHYLREYDVAAVDMDEAMEFICELETQAVPGSLQVARAAKIQGEEVPHKGVYYQSSFELEHKH